MKITCNLLVSKPTFSASACGCFKIRQKSEKADIRANFAPKIAESLLCPVALQAGLHRDKFALNQFLKITAVCRPL